MPIVEALLAAALARARSARASGRIAEASRCIRLAFILDRELGSIR